MDYRFAPLKDSPQLALDGRRYSRAKAIGKLLHSFREATDLHGSIMTRTQLRQQLWINSTIGRQCQTILQPAVVSGRQRRQNVIPVDNVAFQSCIQMSELALPMKVDPIKRLHTFPAHL